MIGSHLGELAARVTAGCWTVSAMSFENAGKKVGSLAVNLIRLPVAFAFLSLYCVLTRGLPLPVDAPAHGWIWLSISGFVGFVAGDLFLFRAFVVVGSRVSMLIMTLVPLFTTLFSRIITGETLEPPTFIGMAVTLAGIGLVLLNAREHPKGAHPSSRPVSGVLFAVGGALGQALGLVLSKYGIESYDPFAATQIRGLAGIAGFCLLFLAIGAWPKVFRAFRNRGAMLGITLGSFFGPFLGVSFSLLSVQHTKAGVATTIMGIVPILIVPPSVLIFKERVNLREVAGAFVAVGGVALLFLLKT